MGKRLLAVVPARGGSKGLPLKNIRPLLGIPLVARVGHLTRELGYFDAAIISTDHPEIAAVARDSGLQVPFMRPEALSGDAIGDLEVLTHALNEMEHQDRKAYDVVVMLQPTSPLRRPEHVTATIEHLITNHFDSAWTVSTTDLKYHPLKQLRVDGGRLDYFDPRGPTIIRRQQLEPVYHRNGACYAFTRECILEQRTILGRRAGAVIVDERMISIDTLEDFEQAEQMLAAR
jgi:CMP-N-acetylneuraminic acid synthetase